MESPPDYEKILGAADLKVEARVRSVELPKTESDLARAVLVVEASSKGSFRKGERISVFYESAEVLKKSTSSGEVSTISRWRCPPFVSFTKGTQVEVYAQWDAQHKRYVVPSTTWVRVME